MPALADKLGTPAYVYSRATLVRHARNLLDAFAGYPTLACFAVKANSNLAVLRHIFGAGLGADLVSGGELRARAARRRRPERIVFSGVGKRGDEIDQALAAGILMFNVESPYELDLISRSPASAGARPPSACASTRISTPRPTRRSPPASTRRNSACRRTSSPPLLERIAADPQLELVGIGCHIGSQIVELQPLRDAAQQHGGACAATLQAPRPSAALPRHGRRPRHPLPTRRRRRASPTTARR